MRQGKGGSPDGMKDHAEGILRLPKAMRRDLVLLLAGKLAMLFILYSLFFSPAHHLAIDALAHIAGPGR